MKKITKILICLNTSLLIGYGANAYQVISSKELGSMDAKNQNIVVKCTTESGKVSDQTCSLRRYARCSGTTKTSCNGWMPWKDLRDPSRNYTDWRSAANDCCRAKGLR